MEDDKAVEELVMLVDVPGNFGPVFHGHVAGVLQWGILQDGVQDPVAFQRPST